MQAAQKLGQMVDITPSVSGITGLDVGGGKSESVAITFKAPVVLRPSTWGNPDTSATARKGLQWAMDTGAQHLNYDAPGVGIGVASTLKHTDVGAMRVVGVNTGNPPTNAVWPDGRTAKEKFGNLKAELWWVLRERFQRTYEHVTWMEKQQAAKLLSDCNPSIGVSPAGDAVRGLFSDDPDASGIPETVSQTVTGDDEVLSRPYLDTDDEEDQGKEHPIDELISLPTGCHTLVTQLSSITYDTNNVGKIVIESKLSLRTRGIASPDQADALALCMRQLDDGEVFPMADHQLIVDPFPIPSHWPKVFGIEYTDKGTQVPAQSPGSDCRI